MSEGEKMQLKFVIKNIPIISRQSKINLKIEKKLTSIDE